MVAFGLGPMPKNMKQKYTLTLIRGILNYESYSAYQQYLSDDQQELEDLIIASKKIS